MQLWFDDKEKQGQRHFDSKLLSARIELQDRLWQAQRWNDLTSESGVLFIAYPSFPLESTTSACWYLCGDAKD